MFEQEIEMEKRQGSVVPLLLIVGLIVAIVGVAGYFLMQNRRVLSNEEASAVAAAVLKAQGPATVRFHTGLLGSSVNDNPSGPQYRLLEKAGLVTLGKMKDWKTPIALTPKGEALLKEIPGVSQTTEKDGTKLYVVPLADRKFVGVSKVTMLSPERAVIDFTWTWNPNQLGDLFDASGAAVKTFNTWDRGALIQKYGANFYHGEPTKVAIAVMKTDKGWQIAPE